MSSAATITRSNPAEDLAVLSIDTPGKGANVLSRSVLDELREHLDELEQLDGLAGLILMSGKPGMFIAGADLREFMASLDAAPSEVVELCRQGQTLFQRMSQCPFVTVAAIDGICFGGGAELAIWCDRRIMSCNSQTEFGFPEVKLGLMTGWGGSARAPRMLGLGNAVEMITAGESIDAQAAQAMGLISQIVPADQLLDAAIQLVRVERETGGFKRDRLAWSGPAQMGEMELGFLGATASALIQGQTKGNYPAPQTALEVMLEGAGEEVDTACQMEAEAMAGLFGSPVNRSLLNVFFLTDRNKKDIGVDNAKVTSAPIESVGVLGAGIMGAGIAAANVKRQLPVVITDTSSDTLSRGLQGILEEVSYNKRTKRADVERALRYAPLLKGTVSNTDLGSCDLVIEAVVENLDVKREIFKRLEPQMSDKAILASNTSSIPITQLADGLRRPEQFCGIHFFNPVRRMKLVEVIRGEKTSDQTIATAVAYAHGIGKSPIVVNDGPGFLVNRLLFPYMQESLELLAEGVSIKAIERAAKKFGMPMGPIELYDMVGIDTAVFAGRTLSEAFPERVVTSPILTALADKGRLGRKSGLGFYSYQNRKRRAQPDPNLEELIKPHVRASTTPSGDELTARLFMPMLLEATRVLESKLVRDASDVDLGLIFGIGFPPFKGGLLFWADSIGVRATAEMIKPLEAIGPRFQPTRLLTDMAKEDAKFYEN